MSLSLGGIIDAFTDKLKPFQSAIEYELDFHEFDRNFIDWIITTLDVDEFDEETFLEDFYNKNLDYLQEFINASSMA